VDAPTSVAASELVTIRSLTRAPEGGESRGAFLPRHEVGGDKVDFSLREPGRPEETREEQVLVPDVAPDLLRLVAEQLDRHPLHREAPPAHRLDQRGGAHRLQVLRRLGGGLYRGEAGLEPVGAVRLHQADDRLGRVSRAAVPVPVEGVPDLRRHGAGADDVEVLEDRVRACGEVFVAHIAAPDDVSRLPAVKDLLACGG
jgi:hypothetical protein